MAGLALSPGDLLSVHTGDDSADVSSSGISALTEFDTFVRFSPAHNAELGAWNTKIMRAECFGSIRRHRFLSRSRRPRLPLRWGLLAAMQISGGGKNYAKVLNDRRGGRTDASVYACTHVKPRVRVLYPRTTRAREQHRATLCRVGDFEWQRVRDFQVGMQISHSRMSRGFDSV